MKLRDFTGISDFSTLGEFAKQIFEWSRKNITLGDNISYVKVYAHVGTSETEVGHSLGRAPVVVVEEIMYPNENATSTGGLTMTRAPEHNKIFLKRSSAGKIGLILF